MSTITETIDVDTDVRSAYDQWTQFESFPRFMEGVERIEQRDETHLHWTISVAGVTREFDATITEQTPDERVAWRSDDGPNHSGEVTFERLDDDRTRVTTKMDIDPEGFVENVADKLGILDRRVKGDLTRFKEFIESRHGEETGAWRGEVGQQRPGGSGATPGAGDPGAPAGPGATPGPGGSGAPPGASGRPPATPGQADLGEAPGELGRPAT